MILSSVIDGSTYLKKQFSQEKFQMCENHQIRRTDFGEKIHFFGAPCALKCTHGGAQGRCPPCGRVRRGTAPALIVVLVWLLCGHRLQQFVNLGGSQCPCTAASQLCTLCEHAVVANLVNPSELGGSARLRGWCPRVGMVSRDERWFTGWSRSWPRTVVGLVAAGEILEHK